MLPRPPAGGETPWTWCGAGALGAVGAAFLLVAVCASARSAEAQTPPQAQLLRAELGEIARARNEALAGTHVGLVRARVAEDITLQIPAGNGSPLVRVICGDDCSAIRIDLVDSRTGEIERRGMEEGPGVFSVRLPTSARQATVRVAADCVGAECTFGLGVYTSRMGILPGRPPPAPPPPPPSIPGQPGIRPPLDTVAIPTEPGPPPDPPPPADGAAPPPTVLRGDYSAVDAALARMDIGAVSFNAPDRMRIGEARRIQLLLSPTATAEELEREIVAEGPVESYRVRVTSQMIARIQGTGFEIRQLSPEQQGLSTLEPTEWNWMVEPLPQGPRLRHLVVSLDAVLETEEGERLPRSVRTFERSIVIEVTWAERISGFVSRNWQWLWGAVLVPFLFPILASRWRRRKPST
jgi:hypothetical protein